MASEFNSCASFRTEYYYSYRMCVRHISDDKLDPYRSPLVGIFKLNNKGTGQVKHEALFMHNRFLCALSGATGGRSAILVAPFPNDGRLGMGPRPAVRAIPSDRRARRSSDWRA